MLIKKLLPALLIVGFIVMFDSCSLAHLHGSGRVVSEDRSVYDFTGIVLDGAGNVNIHSSEYFTVMVTTDSNIQDNITTKVRDGFLYIDEKSFRSIHPTKLVIDVYLPELTCVKLRGAGNIKVNGGNNSDFEIILSGAGNIDARNFEAGNVSIILSGAGDIKTWATNSLTGKLSGVGSIMYRGDPPVKNIQKTGVGNIGKI